MFRGHAAPQPDWKMMRSAPGRIIDIIIWLLPALAALLAWQLMGGARLLVADLADAEATGLYPAEAGDLGPFRWAGAAAELALPGGGLPGVVELRGALAPGAAVTVGVGGAPGVALPIAEAAQIRRVRLLAPATRDALGRLSLRIGAEPPAVVEGRPLSLALSEVVVEPVARGPRLPPIGAWLALAGLPLFVGAWLWLGGAPARLGGLVGAGLGLTLASLWAARPAALTPLLLDLAAFAGAGPLWGWWLMLQLAGLAAWPLCAALFRRLPLAGLPLAPALGLLLAAWPAWALAVAGAAPFGPPTLIASWLLVAALGWGGVLIRRKPPAAISQPPTLRRLLAWQCLLLAGLFAGCWLRWHGAVGPALTGTEKPMELAMLAAVMRAERFPPPDPWLAGYGLNYYYLGYVLVGALGELSGVPPGVAFNLGFALVVGLTALGAAYAAGAMVALTPGLARRAPAAAGLALILALVAGSQFSAIELAVGSPLWRALDAGQLGEALAQRMGGAETIRLSRPTPPSWDGPPFDTIAPAPRSFDWFAPSRAIADDIALADGGVERRYAITEFPAFSLYLGDLHPHVLAMPFNLLALALALACAAGAARGRLMRLLAPAAAGALVGGLYCLNAWDAPTYGLLLAGGLALGRRGGDGRLEARGLAADLALMAGAALLAALPFLTSFVAPAGPARPGTLDGWPLIGRLAAIFGPAPARTSLLAFLTLLGLFIPPILALALAGGRRPWLLGGLIGTALLVGPPLGFPLLALLPLALALAWAAWRAASPGAALARWAAAVGALALLVPELVYIRDHLEGEMPRMITIFKFVFQAWLLWAVAAGAAAAALFRPRQAPAATAAWAAPAGLLLAGALIYPAGLLAWAEPWRPGERTLDGLAFLARESPDELAAAAWLAANVGDDEAALTGFCNCDYELVSRLGAVSGAPTLLGWMDGHERVWRSGAPDQLAVIARREAAIPRIYGGGADALGLLRELGVDYLVVGPVERRLYGEAGPSALAARLEPAFAQGELAIYRVPGADSGGGAGQ